ncbi:WD repeat-containing protein 87 [Planoprotostelium fungivorum]|uniref:WD repeat-containing protein 87 n=1 Tax=Planoprotostelium fungivorum TaxID=1890364 RepID=A0A2P6NIE5_9EUKA|nr:WD repeat-containing protein 87 [Planoprotostelium fungivorum]
MKGLPKTKEPSVRELNPFGCLYLQPTLNQVIYPFFSRINCPFQLMQSGSGGASSVTSGLFEASTYNQKERSNYASRIDAREAARIEKLYSDKLSEGDQYASFLRLLIRFERFRLSAMKITIIAIQSRTIYGNAVFSFMNELHLGVNGMKSCVDYLTENGEDSSPESDQEEEMTHEQGIAKIQHELTECKLFECIVRSFASVAVGSGCITVLDLLPSILSTYRMISHHDAEEDDPLTSRLLSGTEWDLIHLPSILSCFTDLTLNSPQLKRLKEMTEEYLREERKENPVVLKHVLALWERYPREDWRVVGLRLIDKCPPEDVPNLLFILDVSLQQSPSLQGLLMKSIRKRRREERGGTKEEKTSEWVMMVCMANRVEGVKGEMMRRIAEGVEGEMRRGEEETKQRIDRMVALPGMDIRCQTLLDLSVHIMSSTTKVNHRGGKRSVDIRSIGRYMMLRIFVEQERCRGDLLGRIFAQIAEGSESQREQYTILFEDVCTFSIRSLVQHSSKLLEWMGYVHHYSNSISRRIMRSVMPLTLFSTSFMDGMFILIRKLMMIPTLKSKKLCVHGLIRFLSVVTSSPSGSQDVRKDVLSMMKPVLNFPLEAREEMYRCIIEYVEERKEEWMKERKEEWMKEMMVERMEGYMDKERKIEMGERVRECMRMYGDRIDPDSTKECQVPFPFNWRRLHITLQKKAVPRENLALLLSIVIQNRAIDGGRAEQCIYLLAYSLGSQTIEKIKQGGGTETEERGEKKGEETGEEGIEETGEEGEEIEQEKEEEERREKRKEKEEEEKRKGKEKEEMEEMIEQMIQKMDRMEEMHYIPECDADAITTQDVVEIIQPILLVMMDALCRRERIRRLFGIDSIERAMPLVIVYLEQYSRLDGKVDRRGRTLEERRRGTRGCMSGETLSHILSHYLRRTHHNYQCLLNDEERRRYQEKDIDEQMGIILVESIQMCYTCGGWKDRESEGERETKITILIQLLQLNAIAARDSRPFQVEGEGKGKLNGTDIRESKVTQERVLRRIQEELDGGRHIDQEWERKIRGRVSYGDLTHLLCQHLHLEMSMGLDCDTILAYINAIHSLTLLHVSTSNDEDEGRDDCLKETTLQFSNMIQEFRVKNTQVVKGIISYILEYSPEREAMNQAMHAIQCEEAEEGVMEISEEMTVKISCISIALSHFIKTLHQGLYEYTMDILKSVFYLINSGSIIDSSSVSKLLTLVKLLLDIFIKRMDEEMRTDGLCPLLSDDSSIEELRSMRVINRLMDDWFSMKDAFSSGNNKRVPAITYRMQMFQDRLDLLLRRNRHFKGYDRDRRGTKEEEQ